MSGGDIWVGEDRGGDALDHLHVSAQAMARLPAEERLRHVRADRWIGYSRATPALERLETLYAWPGKQRKPNLLLIGDEQRQVDDHREVPSDPPAGPTLLVVDELGYLPLPGEAASALFQVVSQRYLKTSIIITTNRPVAWGEILGDTTVAAAMLDRLLHRSVVLDLDGESYRLRDHHARAQQLRHTITTGTRQPLR